MPKYQIQIFGFIFAMNMENKILTCITGKTVRSVITQANDIGIAKEDIVNIFSLGEQVYLVYYKS